MINVELEMSYKIIFILVYFAKVTTETNLKSVTVSVKTEYKFQFHYDSPLLSKTQNISNANDNFILVDNVKKTNTTQKFTPEINYNDGLNMTKLYPEKNKQIQTENKYFNATNEGSLKSKIILKKVEPSLLKNEKSIAGTEKKIHEHDFKPIFREKTGEKISKYNFFDFTEYSEDKPHISEMSFENTSRHTTPIWLKTKQLSIADPPTLENSISNEKKRSNISDDQKIFDLKKNKSQYVFFENSNEESGEENTISQSVRIDEEEGQDEKIEVKRSKITLTKGYVKEEDFKEIGSRSLELAEKLDETTTKYNFLENNHTTTTKDNNPKYTFFENSKESLDSIVENPMTSTDHLGSVSTYYPYRGSNSGNSNVDPNLDLLFSVDLRRFHKLPGVITKQEGQEKYDVTEPTNNKQETTSDHSFSVQKHNSKSEKTNNNRVTKKYTFFDDSDIYDQQSSEDKSLNIELQTQKNTYFEDMTKKSEPESGENDFDQNQNRFLFESIQSDLKETTTEMATKSYSANDLMPRASRRSIETLDTRNDDNSKSRVYEDSQLDKVLLQEIKKIVAKLNPAYFMIVADKLSIQSTTHLGKQTSTFAISPVCLTALLLTLTSGMKGESRAQIDEGLDYHRNNEERLRAVELLLGLIPPTGTKLSSWSTTRLFVPHELVVRENFKSQAQRALGLNVDSVQTVNASEALKYVNRAIESDTKGRMLNAFDDEDLHESLQSGGLLLANCLYWRGDWQGSVTVLNATSIFHTEEGDQDLAMYRLNDVMRYADVADWNAQAVEIPYAAKDAWLVLLIPREVGGLFNLEDLALNDEKETDILAYLEPLLTTKRVEITLPKYTLESRIMLPSKLKELDMDAMLSNSADLNGIVDGVTRLGSAVQRTKLWADDGRGSFKDDGLQWDPLPDIEIFADRPYIFMLKVKDIVLISGHFYGSGR